MKAKITTLLVFISTGFLFVSQAFANIIVLNPELPESVEVTEVIAAGTGCVGGGGVAASLEDAETLLIDFDGLSAVSGGDASLRDARKFCQVNLTLSYSPGWTYGVLAAGAVIRSRLHTYGSATARLKTHFTGDETMNESSLEVEGPYRGYDDLYSENAEIAYAPCDTSRALNVNASVQVSSNYSESTNRIRFNDPTVLILKWKRCE